MAGRIAYYGNIVTSGLVLNLDAAKRDSYPGSGTTWRDISGNGNNGTLTNGPTFNSDNYGSIVFDGVDDYVNCGNILNSIMSGAGKQFTYNCSFTPQSSQNQILFGKYADSSTLVDERQFGVFTRDSGTGFKVDVIFATNGLPGFTNLVRSDSTLTLNVPNIISVTYDDNQPTSLDKVNIWINGVLSPKTLVVNASFGPITEGTAQFGIGASIASTGATFYRYTGKVFSLNLYARALSTQEILQNYNATKTRYGL